MFKSLWREVDRGELRHCYIRSRGLRCRPPWIITVFFVLFFGYASPLGLGFMGTALVSLPFIMDMHAEKLE